MKLRLLATAFFMCIATLSTAYAVETTTDGSVAFEAYTTWLSAWNDYFATNYSSATLLSTLNTTFGSGSFTSIVANLYSFNVPSSGSLFQETFIWNASDGTIWANYPVAVPGPEAGAGLGALALGGLGYLVMKRRKSAAAA